MEVSKRYRVHGIALVPVEVEMMVDAPSEEIAKQAALQRFKKDPSAFVVHNSQDNLAVHGWNPSTELVN